MNNTDCEKLIPYCQTDYQRAVIEAVIKCGSQRKAADFLCKARSTIQEVCKRIEKRAAKKANLPSHGLTHEMAPGFELDGYSVFTKTPSGDNIWLKAKAEKLTDDIVSAAIKGACIDVESIKVPEFLGTYLDKDIIPWFNIGDGHIGVIAFESETGYDNNIEITKRELLAAMITLIDEAPQCERCVINDLGDMSHYQNIKGISESGHLFDYDKTFPIMIEIYSSVMVAIVAKALEKFKYVDVIINQGNHSRTNDFWMVHLLRAKFDDVDRLTVLNNENSFIPYRMGNTFILTNHGDKAKPADTVGMMSTDYADDWGESVYRYVWTAHTHTMKAKEYHGAVWESWNQINRGDLYSHSHAWRSRKCLSMVKVSRTYGDVGRATIPIERVVDIVANAKPGTAAENKRRKVYTV